MNRKERYVKLSEILDYCRDAAYKNRELAEKCIKSTGKGESETSSLGGAAYFFEQARIFKYDIPIMLKELKVYELDVACDTPLHELGLSTRPYNCLKRSGIKNLGDITNLSLSELMMVRFLGKRGIDEILEMLKIYGVELKTEVQNETTDS